MNTKTFLSILMLTSMGYSTSAVAHHTVLSYDGKREVTISGTLTSARFGYPHSVYRLDVAAEDGSIEKWTLSTEDPRDAERLGFADALRGLKRGDTVTFIGWPDKFKKNTLRGHQLIYPDGRVVMMRRGNYIWPKDILAMDKMALKPDTIPATIVSTDLSQTPAAQLSAWLAEDKHLARIAREYADGHARLIGLTTDDITEFPGVDELLLCHTEREEFTLNVSLNELDATSRDSINARRDYVNEYNRVLSRWWEQEIESCE